MNYFKIFVYFVRIFLATMSIYHIYKRQYKYIRSIVLTFLSTFIPSLLKIVFDIELDLVGSYIYIIVIIMAMYLGNTLKYFDKYFWWDIATHFLSGIVLVSFAVALSKKVDSLNKLTTLYFAFTFSLSHYAIWEVLEYIYDCIFHTNHQRWQKVSASVNHVSKLAIQPAGLVDTMNDTIIGIISTLISCVVWWFICNRQTPSH